MWIYLIVAALVVLGVIGGALGGGIFTIILIPLAFVVLVGWILASAAGRAAQGKAGGATDEMHTTDRPLPHSHNRPSGSAPSSPEALADARRARQ